MSAVSQNRRGPGLAPRTKRIAWIVAVILIVVAMGFGTKVVGA
ncbi:MAG: hypothetical protein QOD05_1013, partial [Microbacteriaceae bacterium]|nr:hypothetical protein [Microbacteriaceae bacterium]